MQDLRDILAQELPTRHFARFGEAEIQSLFESGFRTEDDLKEATVFSLKELRGQKLQPLQIQNLLQAFNPRALPQSDACIVLPLDEAAVCELLMENYGDFFSSRGPASGSERTQQSISAGPDGLVQPLGSYFTLEGFDVVVKQMFYRLLRLERSFVDNALFIRTLQLLRLVAAPGLGKTTALVELWPRLYELVQDLERELDSRTEKRNMRDAVMLERIKNSLRPDRIMVFLLELHREGLDKLHNYEAARGETEALVLALRMLYSSVRQSKRWYDYGSFLVDMDPRLRQFLQPMHVLHFWRNAAGIANDEPWLAVLAIDEVGAAGPVREGAESRWAQHMLSNFVRLREIAVRGDQQERLNCLPVLFTASTRASASRLAGTASGHSKTKDIFVRPLSETQAHQVVRNIISRINGAPVLPADFSMPANAALLFELLGGNPRLLAWCLCALAGRADVRSEAFPAGLPESWSWLEDDISVPNVVDILITAMQQDKWAAWLHGNKAALLNQLVAHVILAEPVSRKELVPSSAKVKWQDLENDGVAYLGQPGELQRFSAGVITMPGPYSTDEDEATDEGSAEPDQALHVVQMPALLLVAAQRHMEIGLQRMVHVPLLNQLSDNWQDRELTDVSLLVAKLHMARFVMKRDIITLSSLLGVVDLGAMDMQLSVPKGSFRVCRVQKQLSNEEFKQLIQGMDSSWAFIGPQNYMADSWLLLRNATNTAVFIIYLQSKSRQRSEAMRYLSLVKESAKCWSVPEAEEVMVYMTDQQESRAISRQTAEPLESMILIPPEKHVNFYGLCASLVKLAVAASSKSISKTATPAGEGPEREEAAEGSVVMPAAFNARCSRELKLSSGDWGCVQT